MVDATDRVTCNRCKKKKQVSEMRQSTRLKRGYYLYCTTCDNAARRAQRAAGPVPDRKELKRKLPPYATLKRLYVDQGMSYSDIAERYDVNRSAVYETLKRRALKHGDPWPLQSLVSDVTKMRRTLAKDTVKPDLIVSMVWDRIERNARRTKPRGRKTPLNIALGRFCKRHKMSPTYLKDLRAGRYKTISRDYAKKLLIAIGEEHDPDLTARRPKKYAGHTRKAA